MSYQISKTFICYINRTLHLIFKLMYYCLFLLLHSDGNTLEFIKTFLYNLLFIY